MGLWLNWHKIWAMVAMHEMMLGGVMWVWMLRCMAKALRIRVIWIVNEEIVLWRMSLGGIGRVQCGRWMVLGLDGQT
jgi:hypothetical protein